MISKLRVPFLVLNFAIYAGFGAAFFAMPVTLAQMIGIELKDTAALADLRAMYGGLCLAVSVVLAISIFRHEYRGPGLLLSVAGGAGLFLGRLITLVFDGPGNEYIYASMVTEIFAVLMGLVLLRGERNAA